MTQSPSEHVYLTPDRPMPDWMYQDANRRLQECVGFLSLWDFLTPCERRRIDARIARWYAMPSRRSKQYGALYIRANSKIEWHEFPQPKRDSKPRLRG
jgi:hypothetical protein